MKEMLVVTGALAVCLAGVGAVQVLYWGVRRKRRRQSVAGLPAQAIKTESWRWSAKLKPPMSILPEAVPVAASRLAEVESDPGDEAPVQVRLEVPERLLSEMLDGLYYVTHGVAVDAPDRTLSDPDVKPRWEAWQRWWAAGWLNPGEADRCEGCGRNAGGWDVCPWCSRKRGE
jgi:hypothetical protein